MVAVLKSNYAVIESENLSYVEIVNRKKQKISFTV